MGVMAMVLAGMLIFVLSWSLTPKEVPQRPPAHLPELTGKDFPIYWAAWRMVIAGEPVYESSFFESWISDPLDETFCLHNPPWVLVFFAPFGALPFAAGLMVWQLTLLGALAGSVQLAMKTVGIPKLEPRWWALACIFLPAFVCWQVGQWTLLLTLASLCLYGAVRDEKPWIAGACLTFMTIKPHLFSLLVIWMGFYILRRRKWMIPLAFAVFFTPTLTMTWWLRPSVFSEWWQWVLSGHAGVWMTGTPASWMRALWEVYIGGTSTWIAPLWFMAGLLICLPWLWRWSAALRFQHWPLLLAGSLLIAPYAWSYDYALLICWQAGGLGIWLAARQRGGSASAFYWILPLTGGILWLMQATLLTGDMHTFMWFPIWVGIAAWHWPIRSSENREEALPSI